MKDRLTDLKKQAKSGTGDAARKRKEDLQAQAARLTEAIGLGGNLPTLVHKLQAVEGEIAGLEKFSATARPTNTELKSGQVREYVVKAVMQLRSVLTEDDVPRAKSALLKHLGKLTRQTSSVNGRRSHNSNNIE